MSKKSAAQKKKRILIVDDHPMMRQGLAQLIGVESDLAVCGDAERRTRPRCNQFFEARSCARGHFLAREKWT